MPVASNWDSRERDTEGCEMKVRKIGAVGLED